MKNKHLSLFRRDFEVSVKVCLQLKRCTCKEKVDKTLLSYRLFGANGRKSDGGKGKLFELLLVPVNKLSLS